MILVVLSTHAELASATARGRSYCETGLFWPLFYMKTGTNYLLKTTLFLSFQVHFYKITPFWYISRTHKKFLFLLPAPTLNRKSYMDTWSTKPIHPSFLNHLYTKHNGKVSKISKLSFPQPINCMNNRGELYPFLKSEYIVVKKDHLKKKKSLTFVFANILSKYTLFSQNWEWSCVHIGL